jgi:peptidoglycan hydrolase-like protein with peptidoglycan-binding domain
MPGLVIGGALELVPGLTCSSWHDDPALRLKIGEDGAPRHAGTWIRAVVLHTTRGIPGGKDQRPQKVLPGLGPARGTARATNQWWSTNGTCAGAHIVVDFDGSVSCLADLRNEMTYHATSVNPHTIGIEIAQGSDAELWEGQLDAVVRLVDWLTLRLGIQRQIPDRYRGPLARLRAGGRDVCGIYGHRDQSAQRGAGDPGDAVFERLRTAGYEAFHLDVAEDLDTWKRRQGSLGLRADGLPGPATCAALGAFQAARGLPETSLIDAATREALDSAWTLSPSAT